MEQEHAQQHESEKRRPRDCRRPRQQQQQRRKTGRRRVRADSKSKSHLACMQDLTDPKELPKHKVKTHLKTIGRCQPASWLSPFADKSAPIVRPAAWNPSPCQSWCWRTRKLTISVPNRRKTANSHKTNTEGIGSNNVKQESCR